MSNRLYKIKAFGLIILALCVIDVTYANQTNLQDLGLYKGKRVDEHTLSAGQPSKQQLKQLAKQGYGTVINLRTAGEFDEFDEKTWVNSLNMQYAHLPIAGASDITFENAAKLAALRNTTKQPTLLHCASGNRVGALIALNHYAKHGNLAQALQVGTKAGMTRLEGRVIEVINQSQKK